jgi:hypothetical protein
MIIGGGGADIHAIGTTATSAIADLTAPAPVYVAGPLMHHARMHLCATLLPDRTVLVNGGSGMEESHGHASPVRLGLPGNGAALHHRRRTPVAPAR